MQLPLSLSNRCSSLHREKYVLLIGMRIYLPNLGRDYWKIDCNQVNDTIYKKHEERAGQMGAI